MSEGRPSPGKFRLDRAYQPFIEQLVGDLRAALSSRSWAPIELAQLARLIYALERLPAITEGAGTTIMATYSSDAGWSGPSLRLDDECLQVCYEATRYESYGSEHESVELLRADATHLGQVGFPSFGDPLQLDDWRLDLAHRLGDPACEISIECVDVSDDEFDWEQPAVDWE